MADGINQRGAPLKLLFASLFLTSFGASAQVAYMHAPGLQPSAPVSETAVVQAQLIQAPHGSVLAAQTATIALAQESTVAATIESNFLSEVMDTASPSASPKPTVSASAKMKKSKPSASPSSATRSIFPTKSPKLTPSPSPVVKKQTVAATPTATPAVLGAAAKVVSTVAQAGSLNADKIFDMVNAHRASIGKVAFLKEDSICKIAQDRAPQVKDELYGGKKMHAGFYALNLPYWATENIAAYATEEQTVNWWLSDYIHKKAIESDNKYSCVACSGRYCSQVFTSFVKK